MLFKIIKKTQTRHLTLPDSSKATHTHRLHSPGSYMKNNQTFPNQRWLFLGFQTNHSRYFKGQKLNGVFQSWRERQNIFHELEGSGPWKRTNSCICLNKTFFSSSNTPCPPNFGAFVCAVPSSLPRLADACTSLPKIISSRKSQFPDPESRLLFKLSELTLPFLHRFYHGF